MKREDLINKITEDYKKSERLKVIDEQLKMLSFDPKQVEIYVNKNSENIIVFESGEVLNDVRDVMIHHLRKEKMLIENDLFK